MNRHLESNLALVAHASNIDPQSADLNKKLHLPTGIYSVALLHLKRIDSGCQPSIVTCRVTIQSVSIGCLCYFSEFLVLFWPSSRDRVRRRIGNTAGRPPPRPQNEVGREPVPPQIMRRERKLTYYRTVLYTRKEDI